MEERISRPRRRIIGFVCWILFALLALAVGVYAYTAHYQWHEALFRSVQLFALEVDAEPETGPRWFAFDIARWLAAALAGVALWKLIVVLLRDQLHQLRVWLAYRGHVVICGAGWKARLLARHYRDCRPEPWYRRLFAAGAQPDADVENGLAPRHARVVVIESDDSNPALAEFREAGATVLIGDATQPAVLRGACVERAARMICLADDMTNLEIAAGAEAYLRSRHDRGLAANASGRRRPFECFVHLDDPTLCQNLRDGEISRAIPFFRREFFSTTELAAERLADSILPVMRAALDAGRPPRLVVVAEGSAGEVIALEMIRRWRLDSPDPAGRKLELRLAGPDADELHRSLPRRLRPLDAVCTLLDPVVSTRLDPEECLTGDEAAAVICLGTESASLNTGLRLSRYCWENGREIPIFLRLVAGTRCSWEAVLESPQNSALCVFNHYAETCRPTLLVGLAERLARAIHARYLADREAAGERSATKLSHRAWDELPPEFKDSNIDQTIYMPRTLDVPGPRTYRIIRMQDVDAADFEFPPDDLEQIARAEHERYRQYKVATNPTLVETDWDGLTDSARETARAQVRAWPRLLASIGFQIRMIDRADESPASNTSPTPTP